MSDTTLTDIAVPAAPTMSRKKRIVNLVIAWTLIRARYAFAIMLFISAFMIGLVNYPSLSSRAVLTILVLANGYVGLLILNAARNDTEFSKMFSPNPAFHIKKCPINWATIVCLVSAAEIIFATISMVMLTR